MVHDVHVVLIPYTYAQVHEALVVIFFCSRACIHYEVSARFFFLVLCSFFLAQSDNFLCAQDAHKVFGFFFLPV